MIAPGNSGFNSCRAQRETHSYISRTVPVQNAVALQCPCWGKGKLAVLRRRQQVSPSVAGRILTREVVGLDFSHRM